MSAFKSPTRMCPGTPGLAWLGEEEEAVAEEEVEEEADVVEEEEEEGRVEEAGETERGADDLWCVPPTNH